jgi:hypothetical protein
MSSKIRKDGVESLVCSEYCFAKQFAKGVQALCNG